VKEALGNQIGNEASGGPGECRAQTALAEDLSLIRAIEGRAPRQWQMRSTNSMSQGLIKLVLEYAAQVLIFPAVDAAVPCLSS
jgi:hypothetical protein